MDDAIQNFFKFEKNNKIDAIQNFFNSFQPLYNKNKYEVDYNFKHEVKKILNGFYFQDAQKYYFNLPTLKQVLNYDYETTNFGRSSKKKATRKLNENEQKFFKIVFEIIEEYPPLKPINQNDWYKLPDPFVIDLPMVRDWLSDDDDLSPSQSQTSSPKKDIEKFINESSFMNSLPRSFVSSVASLGSIASIASSITEYGNSPKQMKKNQEKKRKRKYENFDDVMIEISDSDESDYDSDVEIL